MHYWFYINIIYELIFTIPETMGSPCILEEVAVKAKITISDIYIYIYNSHNVYLVRFVSAI